VVLIQNSQRKKVRHSTDSFDAVNIETPSNSELPSRRLPAGGQDDDESSGESGDEYVQEKRIKLKKRKRGGDVDKPSRKRKRKVRTEQENEDMESQDGMRPIFCCFLRQLMSRQSARHIWIFKLSLS
jgi:hypothetical protein